MSRQDFIRKITSRKFLISLASFLGSLGAGIVGIQTGDETLAKIGIACAVLSSAIYSGCEAYVDASKKVEATDGDKDCEEK